MPCHTYMTTIIHLFVEVCTFRFTFDPGISLCEIRMLESEYLYLEYPVELVHYFRIFFYMLYHTYILRKSAFRLFLQIDRFLFSFIYEALVFHSLAIPFVLLNTFLSSAACIYSMHTYFYSIRQF